MSRNALRAALAVFLLGVLGVWLITPIGDPCPEVGRLPAGSQSSSAPSFAPPLTRTCTYTTTDGTEAHQRYVPIVDWLVVAVVAGVVGAGVGLAGPGAPPAERAPGPKRGPRPKRARRPKRAPRPDRAPRVPRERKPARAVKRAPRAATAPRARPAAEAAAPDTAEERAAAREREREERARRRERG